MKLSIIKILTWSTGLLAACFAVLLLLVHLQHNRIKTAITQTINDQIDSRFSYADFELSLISYFPFVRARMTDVYLTGKDRLPFIHAGNLDLKLDLRSLFRSEIDFRNVQLSSGTVYLIEMEDHSFNYQVFKTGKEESTTAINLMLRNIELKDMIFIVDLKAKKQRYRTYISHLLINGQYSDAVLHLKADGELVANYLKLGDQAWFENEEIKVELEMHYYTEDEKVEIHFPLLQTSAIVADGNLLYEGKIDLLKAQIASRSFSIPSLLHSLPDQLSSNEFFRSLSGSGQFDLDLKRQGEQQSLNIEFSLKDGEYKSPDQSLLLTQLQGDFNFLQESEKSGIFDILALSANIGGEKIALSGQLIDWGQEQMQLVVKGKIPLLPIYQLTGNKEPDKWELASGFLTTEGLNWSSSNREGEEFRIHHISGILFPEKIDLILAGESFSFNGGRINLQQNKQGNFSLIEVEANDSRFTFSLQMENFTTLIEGNGGDDLQLMLAADYIHLDQWLGFYQKWNSMSTDKDVRKKEQNTQALNLNVQLTADQLDYQGTQYQNISSYLGIRPEGIIFNLEGDHAEGSLSADGYYSFGEIPFLSFRLSALKMDLPTVFRQWDNFEQDFIGHQHLAGQLQGHISGKIFWDKQGNYDKIHSEVIAAFEFHDGELNNFPMLQSFSTYLKAEELSNIKFDKVSNIILMRDGTFYFPSMFIRSNAVNLTVSGAHTLDHEIRYGVRLNAAQALGRRLLSRNPSFSPLPARESGFLNLHFLLTGTTDEVAYRNSTSEVSSLFRQTENLRDRALMELFNTFGDLPYFKIDEFREEIPEFPQSGDFEEMEYLPGFEG